MATSTATMTTEEFLALPDDDTERMLIRGELWENSLTTRNFPHSRLNMQVGYVFISWLETQPEPRGVVIGGEARVRIRRDPDTIVGVDVAYISPELAAQTPPDAKLVDGPPTLAVEILSPTDKQEEIIKKIREYLDAGVPLIWLIEPILETITVYRPGAPTRTYSVGDEIDAEPHLPGFRVPVARVFAH